MASSEPELFAERRSRAGVITLNRPKARNALAHAMVNRIMAALRAWADVVEAACPGPQLGPYPSEAMISR